MMITSFVILLSLYHFGKEITAAQDIILERTDPAEQLPCPGQRVEFQCHTQRFSSLLRWELPNSNVLTFTGGSSDGTVRNTTDNNYSAVLTRKVEDSSPDSEYFKFYSTLLVIRPLNGTSVKCSGAVGLDSYDNSSSILISGSPDTPLQLTYMDDIVIEVSVMLQWSRPFYTGGVSVFNYTITANERTMLVRKLNATVTYRPGLIYGDVLVTAINSCGHKSQPATVTIPSSSPPKLAKQAVELFCDDSLEDGRRVVFKWMDGAKDPGIVYPDISEVKVELDGGNISCSSVKRNDKSCTVSINSNKNHTVRTIQRNSIGSTYDIEYFDSKPLQAIVIKATTDSIIVNCTVQKICRSNVDYTLTVKFGGEEKDGSCIIHEDTKNVTVHGATPGDTYVFTANETTHPLPSGQIYCFQASLTSGSGSVLDSISGGSSDVEELSTAAIAGISVTVVVCIAVGITALLSIASLATIYTLGRVSAGLISKRLTGSS